MSPWELLNKCGVVVWQKNQFIEKEPLIVDYLKALKKAIEEKEKTLQKLPH